MLWLPPASRGMLQVMAGGDGYQAALSPDFLQRAVADAALPAEMRSFLHQLVLAGPDRMGGQAATLSAWFAALVDEAGGRHPASAAMAALHLATLLLHLWRRAGPPLGTGPGAGTAQRFRLLVELHYRDGLRVDEFAATLGVTRAHLHDACLRATGRTPLALVHERLLAEARARLEQTDLAVEQVGYGIGFRDPGYFNRFFKRLTGESPGAYRRRMSASRAPAAAASFAAWP
jgi:AraC family transcriptional activator of pobA